MDEKISIIVPVYNVEGYLEECINSLIHQTYLNIDIILIDDGSSDSSGEICDKYKKIDNRIQVVHKKNGGVSSARNAGLSLVNTKYISFVDPDDYVSEQFIEKLYNSLIENSADIAVCNFFTIKGKNIFEEKEIRDKNLNQEEALRLLVKDEIMSSYLWNKLFKRELFNNLQFDIGYRYEDIRMGTTTLVAAVINLAVNLTLISFIGIYAAAISTLIANFVIYIYRKSKVKKYIVLWETPKKSVIAILITVIILILFYSENIFCTIIACILALIYAWTTNQKIISSIILHLKNKGA